jgi:gamma-butyrobetaine dioxygenase
VFEYDAQGTYRQIRFNTKLDDPVLRPGIDLDGYYAGRRWLTEWLNDPSHQVTFRLEPGDVMFMDNHRALHGRTQFDSSKGRRHLQGGYIDHDGPDTMYRLAIRRRRASMSA